MTRRFYNKTAHTIKKIIKKYPEEVPIIFECDYKIHKYYIVRKEESLHKVFTYIQQNLRRLKKDSSITLYFLLRINHNYVLLNCHENVQNLINTHDIDTLNIKLCIENTFG